ncbi:hypothetical protein JCM1841_001676 [Sporobolomyces salmonicolor]
MLPLPSSTASRTPTPILGSTADDKLHTSTFPAPIRRFLALPLVLRLRQQQRQHPRRFTSFGFLLLLAGLSFLVRSAPERRAHASLAWGAHPDAVVNWGDHVGLGLNRAKALASTPPGYADITDKLPYLDQALSGPLYRKRRSEEEARRGVEAIDLTAGKDTDRAARKARSRYEKGRHGVLGGASVEWSSGVVGSGTWLGPGVDMRKDGTYEHALHSPSSLEVSAATTRLSALTEHIVDKGWVYLDAEDQANSEKLLAEAKEKDFLDRLPLRDQVRGDEEGMRKAAEGWSRVYGAMAGEWSKSALELQLERLVRRAPVVVFSKTTCPYSKRAKELLQQYDLRPAAHVVEVDQRPDAISLKALLTRRTRHSTFPNVIIGSRSIGGADDLDRLAASGELGRMLDEVGVRWQRP